MRTQTIELLLALALIACGEPGEPDPSDSAPPPEEVCVPQYEIEALALTPETDMPLPRHLSPTGDIVGTDGWNNVIWTAENEVIQIDTGDTQMAMVYTINTAREVVGSMAVGDEETGYYAHPARWTPDGGAVAMVEVGQYGELRAINEHGDMAGRVRGDAVVMDAAGDVLFRGQLAGMDPNNECILLAMSDDGTAVGDCILGAEERRAIVWTAETGLLMVKGADKHQIESARAIAADGTIAMESYFDGFALLPSGERVLIPIVDEPWELDSMSVEGAATGGRVVGVQRSTAFSQTIMPQGVLFQDGHTFKLVDMLPAADAAQWEIFHASDIADNGDIIGRGYLDGSTRAFIMRPVDLCDFDGGEL